MCTLITSYENPCVEPTQLSYHALFPDCPHYHQLDIMFLCLDIYKWHDTQIITRRPNLTRSCTNDCHNFHYRLIIQWGIIGWGGGGVIASLIILHTTMRKLGNHLCKTNFVTIKLVPIFSKPTKLCTQTRFMWNFPNMLLGLLVAHLRLLHFMRVNYAMSPN